MKAYYAARETHHKKTEAVLTVFVDRVIGLWSMLLFALDPSPDPFQHPANALYVTHADGSDLTKVVGGNDFKREPVWLRP